MWQMWSDGLYSLQSLRRHIIFKHSSSPDASHPFQCTICQHRVSDAYELKEHMRKHTQEPGIFLCSYAMCNKKSFTRHHNLRAHLVAVHGEVLPGMPLQYKCKHCDSTFQWKKNLWRHEKKQNLNN